jgi:hypothetical protein
VSHSLGSRMLLHVYGQFVKQVKDFRSSLSILSSQACSGLSVELFKHRHYSMYIFFFCFFSTLRSVTFVYHSCHVRLSTASRAVLWPTQPPVQWIPDSLSLGESDRGVQLTTYPYLVTRLRISGVIPLLSYIPTYIHAFAPNFTVIHDIVCRAIDNWASVLVSHHRQRVQKR